MWCRGVQATARHFKFWGRLISNFMLENDGLQKKKLSPICMEDASIHFKDYVAAL